MLLLQLSLQFARYLQQPGSQYFSKFWILSLTETHLVVSGVISQLTSILLSDPGVELLFLPYLGGKVIVFE